MVNITDDYDYRLDKDSATNLTKIFFNFCRFVNSTNRCSSSQKESYATLKYFDEKNTCYRLTGDFIN
jgi:hypothetical protein